MLCKVGVVQRSHRSGGQSVECFFITIIPVWRCLAC